MTSATYRCDRCGCIKKEWQLLAGMRCNTCLTVVSSSAYGDKDIPIAKLEEALRSATGSLIACVAAIDTIGGSDAFHGTMGDDGQGHDEGSIVAGQMLTESRRTIDAAREALGDE